MSPPDFCRILFEGADSIPGSVASDRGLDDVFACELALTGVSACSSVGFVEASSVPSTTVLPDDDAGAFRLSGNGWTIERLASPERVNAGFSPELLEILVSL